MSEEEKTEGEEREDFVDEIYEKEQQRKEAELKETIDKKVQERQQGVADEMGFVTKSDFSKYVEESNKKIAELLEQNEKLISTLKRAKAQGKASFPAEEKDEKAELRRIYPDLAEEF